MNYKIITHYLFYICIMTLKTCIIPNFLWWYWPDCSLCTFLPLFSLASLPALVTGETKVPRPGSEEQRKQLAWWIHPRASYLDTDFLIVLSLPIEWSWCIINILLSSRNVGDWAILCGGWGLTKGGTEKYRGILL